MVEVTIEAPTLNPIIPLYPVPNSIMVVYMDPLGYIPYLMNAIGTLQKSRFWRVKVMILPHNTLIVILKHPFKGKLNCIRKPRDRESLGTLGFWVWGLGFRV